MSQEGANRRILSGMMAGKVIGDGLVVLPGQGNSLAIDTDAGVVVIDAGGYPHAPGMFETLREHTDSPVHSIVYSHGHMGYNAAVDVWQAHNAERGDPPIRLVAHERLVARYERYRETEGLQVRLAAIQFPSRTPLEKRAEMFVQHEPTETFADSLPLVGGRRRVQLIHAPSEVDDAVAVWLPDDDLLFGGAATPGNAIPNIGTPLRTQRFTIRWAESLDRLASLGAGRLLTEFGPLVEGADAVRERLDAMARALRWLRNEVVDRLNRGMGEGEILADMTYPADLFDRPWMKPNYGSPDYIVRDLVREESGWWDRNPTTLHPAPPAAAGAAVLSALGDTTMVLTRAEELAEQGETQLALHVIDLLALAPGDSADVVAARALKAELCRTRAGEVDPFVSKSCYKSSANLLDDGHTSWTRLR
ncbi:MAG: MBL fold metallo-hydrolase [Actinomycetia bacterium]|nr:MBL fold metallo-hydrolase [Actinomycetes bacterium]MCP4085169.1 MBL fold metallo-hydrolase [Actinomycetes bacterium]